MTASSSCSGSVDNFGSRDDIRVHTSGFTPRPSKSSLRDLFEASRPAPQYLSAGIRRSTTPAHHRTLAEQRFELEPLRRELPVLISVGISLAPGLTIDGSDHRVRLASTRFHSPLANPCRRPSSMGAPPMSEARELARIVV